MTVEYLTDPKSNPGHNILDGNVVVSIVEISTTYDEIVQTISLRPVANLEECQTCLQNVLERTYPQESRLRTAQSVHQLATMWLNMEKTELQKLSIDIVVADAVTAVGPGHLPGRRD